MTLLEVKHKISSVQVIKKITRAMQLVASVKYQKAVKVLKSQDEYFLILEQIVCDIFSEIDSKTLARMFHKDKRKFKRRLFILITSDLGFCGAFNYNVVRNLLADFNSDLDKVAVFGKKGLFILAKHEISPVLEFENSNFIKESIDMIIPNLSIYYEFLHNDYRELIIIYNKYISPIKIETVRHSVWPIEQNVFKNDLGTLFTPARKRASSGEPIMMIFEPSRIEVIREVFPNYLLIILYSCIINSFVSENSMRKVSMDSANKNCQELIDGLILKRNSMRQASITAEILEVISSFNA